MKRRLSVLAAATALAVASYLVAVPPAAEANHSWGSYHWARTSNPFTLKVGDNVDGKWDAYLDEAIADWNPSTVLNLVEVTGRANPRNCRATSGQVEVCNSTYGNNGWLGVAQIWVSSNHITQAVAKMNDSYFNMAAYNTPAWRRLVMCQEIAHDFGLGHQDEQFDNPNVGSCMDYTNDPDGGAGGASETDPSNEHPTSLAINGGHSDFQQLETIYNGHADSTSTVSQATSAAGRSGTAQDEGPNNPAEFGRPVGPKDGYGRYIVFEKDIPGGRKIITHVTWTLPGSAPGAPPRQ